VFPCRCFADGAFGPAWCGEGLIEIEDEVGSGRGRTPAVDGEAIGDEALSVAYGLIVKGEVELLRIFRKELSFSEHRILKWEQISC
jgi:hypothetical protein